MQAEIPRNTGILRVFSRFMMGLVQPIGKVHKYTPKTMSRGCDIWDQYQAKMKEKRLPRILI